MLIPFYEWHVEPERYRDFLDECWQKYEQYKDSDTTFNLKDHLWTLYLYERGLFKIPEGLADDTIYDGCNCGNCHFTISAEGRLMACRRFDSYVGTGQPSRHRQRPRGIHEKELLIRCKGIRFCCTLLRG